MRTFKVAFAFFALAALAQVACFFVFPNFGEIYQPFTEYTSIPETGSPDNDILTYGLMTVGLGIVLYSSIAGFVGGLLGAFTPSKSSKHEAKNKDRDSENDDLLYIN